MNFHRIECIFVFSRMIWPITQRLRECARIYMRSLAEIIGMLFFGFWLVGKILKKSCLYT